MYQPALRTDQVEALYYLKLKLRKPMTRILQQALDHYLKEMEHKGAQANRHGLTLLDWVAYEEDMEKKKASDAGKQSTGLQDVNAPF